MLIPVGDQHGLAVRAFNKVFQGVEFAVVDMMAVFILVIDRAVCHLEQLAGKHRRICRIDLRALYLCDHILLESVIYVLFLLVHIHGDSVYDAFRQLEVIAGLHGDGDVRYLLIDLLLHAGKRLIAEHDLAVALIRGEIGVPVMRDVPSEPFSEIEQTELRPQIYETVR